VFCEILFPFLHFLIFSFRCGNSEQLVGTALFLPRKDSQLTPLIRIIGCGLTSNVYECLKGDDHVAIKHYKIDFLSTCKNEIHALQFLSTSSAQLCVPQFLGLTDDNKAIVMKPVLENFSPLYWDSKPEMFGKSLAEIVKALQFAHSGNILHTDIRPPNILQTTTPDKKLYLADWGYSIERKTVVKGKLHHRFSSQRHLASKESEYEFVPSDDLESLMKVAFAFFWPLEIAKLTPSSDSRMLHAQWGVLFSHDKDWEGIFSCITRCDYDNIIKFFCDGLNKK
jgi:serine/threonine protein kinase